MVIIPSGLEIFRSPNTNYDTVFLKLSIPLQKMYNMIRFSLN